MATLYQRVCFPVYGIQRVHRRDHIVIDRHLITLDTPLDQNPNLRLKSRGSLFRVFGGE